MEPLSTNTITVKERAEMLFTDRMQTVIERQREYAKSESIHICNVILISLEGVDKCPPQLVQYWLKVKKQLEKM